MNYNVNRIMCLFAISMVAMLLFTGIVMGEVARDGLVAEYLFEGDAKDSSGNGNDGRINGPAFVDGIKGKALSFDGIDDYVIISDSPSLDLTSELTIEAWVKPNNIIQKDGAPIISKGTGGGGEVYGFDFVGPTGHDLRFYGWKDTSYYGCKFEKFLENYNNKWTHIVVTYGNGISKLYVDNYRLLSCNDFPASLGTNDHELTIGSRQNRDTIYDLNFDGIIDEVRIYNRALSDSEVKTNYEAAISYSNGKQKIPQGKISRDGLVAEYLFEGDAKDSSGNGNDGTIYGANFVDGVSGKAMNFDGVDDYVEVGNRESLNPTSAITIESWVNFNSLSAVQYFISKPYTSAYEPYHQYGLIALDTSKINLALSIGGTRREFSTTQTIAPGQWYHIVGTYDGSVMKVYINGNQDPTTLSVSGSISSYSTNLTIGRWSPGPHFFYGLIDEVRIYNRALSDSEVKANYEATKTLSDTIAATSPVSQTTYALKPTYANTIIRDGLVAEWHFNGDAKDSSGNGNDGTIYGATFVDGTNGKALRFNGIDNYVSVPDSASLDITNAITIEALVKREVANAQHSIAGRWEWSAGPYRSYYLELGNNNNAGFFLSPDGEHENENGRHLTSFSTISAGQWNHITGVYDGNYIKLYINGILDNSEAYNAGIAHRESIPFEIGRQNPSNPGSYFNGIIDEVRIYNRALSDSEVKANYEVVKNQQSSSSPAPSNSGSGNWQYSKEITIKENSGKTLTDYQVQVQLSGADFPSNVRSDGADISFSDKNGDELNYWIEEWDYIGKKTNIWVKIPRIPANGYVKINIRSGNPEASSISSGDKIFEFFDDYSTDKTAQYTRWIPWNPENTNHDSFQRMPNDNTIRIGWGNGADIQVFRYPGIRNGDYSIQAKIKNLDLGTGTWGFIGLIISNTNQPTVDERNAISWGFTLHRDGKSYISKSLGDGNQPIPAHIDLTPDTPFTIRISKVGNTFYFYRNEILIYSSSDIMFEDITYAGYLFGGCWDNDDHWSKADDFFIREYTYPEPTISFSTPGVLTESQAIAQQTISSEAIPTSPVSNNNILEKASNYKVLLDSNPSLLDSATLSRGTYYVISYSNTLPYAGGIKVLSSDGTRITSESEIEPIFTSIAWKDASSQLKPSDIQTLRDILQTSKEIESSVTPVLGVTGTTVNSINSLKGACISVPFVGQTCAWDAVIATFPGIDLLSGQLETLNNELNQWKSAASLMGDHLPNAITGIEQAKNGGDIDPGLQGEISQSLSAFGTLQSRTNEMSGKLASMSSTLSDAEGNLRIAAETSVVGGLISPVAGAIGDMRSKTDSLKTKADSFSSRLGDQSAKLSAVTETANQRTSELKDLWNARQNASTKVYLTLFALGFLVLLILAIYLRKKKPDALKSEMVPIIEKPSLNNQVVKPVENPVLVQKNLFEEEKQKMHLSFPPEKLDPDTRLYLTLGVNEAILKLNADIAKASGDATMAKEELKKNEEVLGKLEMRLVNKEISEDTYKNIGSKYKSKISEIKNRTSKCDTEAEKLKKIRLFIQEKGKYYI